MDRCTNFYSNLNSYCNNNAQDKGIKFSVVDFLILNFTDNTYTNALRDRLIKRVLLVDGEAITYRELIIYSQESSDTVIELIPCGQYAYSDDCKYFSIYVDKYGKLYHNRKLCYIYYDEDNSLCLDTLGGGSSN